MKRKLLIIFAIGFFIAVNTTYYWDSMLGMFAFPAFMLLVLVYFVLAVCFLLQLVFAIREKYSDRQRLYTVALLAIVLVLVFLMPGGMIDFSRFEGRSLLVANREGAANCMTTFKLKEGTRFTEHNVCFGVSKTKGNYELKSDTLYFTNIVPGRHEDEYYQYAVIKPRQLPNGKTAEDLVFYHNAQDTAGRGLWIKENHLKE